jgi:hypothetical protein
VTKPRAQVAPAQPAGATPEPPRQTAETAAEAGVPVVGQEPAKQPENAGNQEPPQQPADSTGEANAPAAGEQPDDDSADEATRPESWNKEGFGEFLRNAFTDEEFAQLWEMVEAEAKRRGTITQEPTTQQPVDETPEADPHAAVREAMEAGGVSTAYVLPDGSWRFSEAFALKAVDGNPDLITVIEA